MIDRDAHRLHEAVDEVVRMGGDVDFRVANVDEVAGAEELVVDLRAKSPRLEVLILGDAPSDGSLALARGFRPGLTREGGSVVYLAPGGGRHGIGGWLTKLDDLFPEPSVSVNSVRWDGGSTGGLEGGAEQGEGEVGVAMRCLASLRGEVRGYDFEVGAVARAVETTPVDEVFARLVEIGRRFPDEHA